jgi:hypothetical protein
MGYKVSHFTCTPYTAETSLRHFIIGCYFSDYLPLLSLADLLPPALKNTLTSQTWIS